MKFLRLFLLTAAPLPFMMGCWDFSGPDSPEVSVPGFVPLAVGNAWVYSYRHTWGNGHDGDREIDSGSRRITIISKEDSAGMNLYHARVVDSIVGQFYFNTFPYDPKLTVTDSLIGILEDSTRIRLVPGTVDDFGMLAASFRSHAFPAGVIHKVPGDTFGIPGAPDTLWVAKESQDSGAISAKWEQGQGIGQLDFALTEMAMFYANGLITSSRTLEYRLVEFHLAQ